jgi:hypothetical protein
MAGVTEQSKSMKRRSILHCVTISKDMLLDGEAQSESSVGAQGWIGTDKAVRPALEGACADDLPLG